MKTHGDDHDGGIVAEINMIPLIDVALVLLIIFMIMTPLLVQTQIEIQLPQATAPDDRAAEDPILAQVTREGAIYLQGQPVVVADLDALFTIHFPVPGRGALIIEADRDCAFETVVEVMDAAKRRGVTKLGVGVLERKPAGGKGRP